MKRGLPRHERAAAGGERHCFFLGEDSGGGERRELSERVTEEQRRPNSRGAELRVHRQRERGEDRLEDLGALERLAGLRVEVLRREVGFTERLRDER